MANSTNATDLSGKVAVVTGAARAWAAPRPSAWRAPAPPSSSTTSPRHWMPPTSSTRSPPRRQGYRGRRRRQSARHRRRAGRLRRRLGGLGIVVNNAGITRDRMLFNMSDEEWDAVIAVHLRGHFLLTRNAAAYWRAKAKESGGPVYGRIVNTSSEAGLVGPVGQANYAAAKAGITALTLSAARALGRYGVCANVICPRARTAMTAEVFGEAPETAEIDPLSPDHVVTLVRFLASPAAEAVNGQLFIVYGPRVTLVAAPTVERQFAADGPAWDPDTLSATLHDYFAGRDPERNFSATGLMGS
ncbi:short chain dehydrogenase [Mycobacterium xenopi 3993]|nr:short chain dehydrogenase [Mycobacterium xenopi 3993]